MKVLFNVGGLPSGRRARRHVKVRAKVVLCRVRCAPHVTRQAAISNASVGVKWRKKVGKKNMQRVSENDREI